MIIIRLKSGLGNQFFQYAIGLGLSFQRNTSLLFDISLFREKNRSFKLQYFDLEYKLIPKWKVIILRSKLVDKVFYFSKNKLFHKTINDPIWMEINFSNEISNNLILTGYWSFNEYFDKNREKLRDLFKLSSDYYNPIYLKILEKIQHEESVAIHVRRGDYVAVKIFKDLFGTIPIKYYKESIKLIYKNLNNPKFYIFSDDPEWVRNKVIKMENCQIVSGLEFVEDIHEFDLMRNCKHHIIANSTFSWWAAYLNNYDNRIIIQPKVWYKAKNAQSVYESGKFLNIPGSIRI